MFGAPVLVLLILRLGEHHQARNVVPAIRLRGKFGDGRLLQMILDNCVRESGESLLESCGGARQAASALWIQVNCHRVHHRIWVERALQVRRQAQQDT
jgi:hypothetical protein